MKTREPWMRVAALGLGVLLGAASTSPSTARLRARDIAEHLQSLGPWVDWKATVDTFKVGDPEREVRTVVVSWMSTLEALQKARTMDCDLFITHEPTFYSHMDNDPSYDTDKATIEKRKLLSQTRMAVYRCHDVWDRVPRIGVLDSWARALGLEDGPAVRKDYYAVYDIPATTVEAFAKGLARRLQRFGQEAVQVTGDLKDRVHRLAIGTGAITNPKDMYALGADAAIVTEVVYWRDVRWAKDMGFPLFIVSHAVSECPGIENLAKYLQDKYPGLRVEYIQAGCPFRLIGPGGPLPR
jgi:putative NIF3 family GTP cyclohydrolase 1 type 2